MDAFRLGEPVLDPGCRAGATMRQARTRKIAYGTRLIPDATEGRAGAMRRPELLSSLTRCLDYPPNNRELTIETSLRKCTWTKASRRRPLTRAHRANPGPPRG